MFPHLRNALSHERKTVIGEAGVVSYYARGKGRPVLLLHSINAAASAFEMKPIFEQLTGDCRIYAPDLPGFGFSDRTDRDYSIELYVSSIQDMLNVAVSDGGPGPIDAVALSLSSEFLARAVLKQPERFNKLVFITPTGFDHRSASLTGPPGSTRQVRGVLPALSLPWLGDALFTALTSHASIRYFLRKTYGSDQIDEGLFDYAYETAHQPGAKHAPFAFLSGKLFSADIHTVYQELKHPIWMPHGTRGDFADFTGAAWVKPRANWNERPYSTGALVHFEQPRRFLDELQSYLEITDVGSRST